MSTGGYPRRSRKVRGSRGRVYAFAIFREGVAGHAGVGEGSGSQGLSFLGVIADLLQRYLCAGKKGGVGQKRPLVLL